MANTEIFLEHDSLRRPLAWSVALHAGVTVLIVLYGAFASEGGTAWGAGGGGGAIGVSLVTTVPLPASPTQTQNVLANESKGLSQSQPKEEEKEPEAIPIPEQNAKNKPRKKPSASERKPPPQPAEEASNIIPFGEGGPVSGPYGMFNAGGAKGGFGVTGGGGDFGTRYAWYVRALQQKVTQNWLQYEVDPRITDGHRVYVTFDIDRSGHPSNIRIEQSSGVPSLDMSALRAIQRIDTFGPLPSDYSGNNVSVEFWFDYKKPNS
jgi:periplasmic protein TonB